MDTKLHLMSAMDDLGNTGGDIDTDLNDMLKDLKENKKNETQNNDIELQLQNKNNPKLETNQSIQNLFQKTHVGLQNNLFSKITEKNLENYNLKCKIHPYIIAQKSLTEI